MSSEIFYDNELGNANVLDKVDILTNRTEDTYTYDASIVIPCRDESVNLKNTVDSIMNSKNRLSFEIIVVDDGSTDGCCEFINNNRNAYPNLRLFTSKNLGPSAARNLGGDNALGKYIFFCDAHVTVPDYWLDKLIKTLEENNADVVVPAIKDNVGGGVGYGETWREKLQVTWLGKPNRDGEEVALAPGGAFGLRKTAFDNIGGFERHFEVWGKEDEEISLKLWLFGYKIVVDSSVEVIHLFKLTNNYGVTHIDFMHNFLCMAFSHFGIENLIKAFDMVKDTPGFPEALARVMLNEDLLRQRRDYFSRRKFDENYFFNKFDIKF
ncbi:glycosyltransferase [Clostridium sp. CX1]|uniref:glycosyltransferase family 2 protein n=1 Tax=Clostridium sp. CX1 TaxID=2978346 RepID=UPI0021BFDDA5|nr:glycosyltransferase family 2 protein [Clostridium sp. CX1]MCT8977276.1 glycosyltransferase [Clostridium sp. CX1]